MNKVLMWDITGKCNLRCKHCYNLKLIEQKNKELNLHETLEFIDKIPIGTHLHILGGEPFMKDNFINILEYFHTRKITYSIVTNGTLLNKDVICKLIKTNITNIIFSLDGPDKITHERIRGKNTFYKLLNNISLLKKLNDMYKKNIKISINITINKFNYKMISEFYKCLEKISVDEVIFNKVQMEGNAINNDLSITNKSWIDTCENIAYNSKNGIIETILYARPLLLSYLNVKYATNFSLDILQCGVLKNKTLMYIKNDGLVYPCNKWYKINEIYGKEIQCSVKNMNTRQFNLYSNQNIMYKEIINLNNKINNYRDKICEYCRFKQICSGCILDLYENDKLINNIDECIEVKNRIKRYKDGLEKIEEYTIRKNLIIEFDKDIIIIKNKALNKKIILKGYVKNLFNDIYNKNIGRNLGNKEKDYFYELKRLNIIEKSVNS